MAMPRYTIGALALILAGLTMAGCSDTSPIDSPAARNAGGKVVSHSPGTPVLPGSWIVVLRDDVPDVDLVVADLRKEIDMGVTHVFRYVLKGFAARLGQDDVVRLAADPRVLFVEPDMEMRATAQTVDWGIRAIGADSSSARSGDGTGTVSGVEVYVLDTGCDMDHPDLNINSTLARNYTTDSSVEDGHGHGTHCAGIIAAMDNTSFTVGVVPGAPVIPLKVLANTGSGYNSWIISALDYIGQRKAANTSTPMVASMSLGGGVSPSLDAAVTGAVNVGIVVVAAAGNENDDALNHSPARAEAIITVGAYGSTGNRASFSNYGRRVDVFAPGVNILSTYKNGTSAYLSGTSMACPYVAGCAALLLSGSGNASMTPLQVRNQLVYDSKNFVYSGTAKTTNRSVYVRNY